MLFSKAIPQVRGQSCGSIIGPSTAVAMSPIPFVAQMTSGNYTFILVNFGDGTAVSQNNLTGLTANISHTYTTFGSYIVSATARNSYGNCSLTQNQSLVIVEEIKNLMVTIPFPALATLPSNFSLTVSNGSDVSYFLRFGDGSNSTVNATQRSAKLQPTYFSHVYKDPLQHTSNISIIAFNSVSGLYYDNCTVQIMASFQNLSLTGNSSVVWPTFPVGSWQLAVGQNQPPLENIVCIWTFSDVQAAVTVPVSMLDANNQINATVTYQRKDVGMKWVSVNCSNWASSIALNMTVEVILDKITLGSLTYDGPVFWNTTVTFVLNITRFGTGACFLWDMGDKSRPIIQMGDNCTVNTWAPNPIYRHITPWSQLINLTYWYATDGVYTVTVTGFNIANNDTKTLNATLMPWPCQKPIVTLANKTCLSQSTPCAAQIASGFEMYPAINISCMKNELTTLKWEVFNSANVLVNTTINTNTYRSPPYQFPSGTYNVRLTVSMYNHYFNISSLFSTIDSYITIVSSPLKAGISGGPYLTYPYNKSLLINASSLTYDPDVFNVLDISGMTFRWYCEQTSETGPTIMQFVFYSGSYSVYFSFRLGPRMVFNLAALTYYLDTSYMKPFTNYTLRLVAFKDIRYVSYDLALYITHAEPPVISLGLVNVRLHHYIPTRNLRSSNTLLLSPTRQKLILACMLSILPHQTSGHNYQLMLSTHVPWHLLKLTLKLIIFSLHLDWSRDRAPQISLATLRLVRAIVNCHFYFHFHLYFSTKRYLNDVLNHLN